MKLNLPVMRLGFSEIYRSKTSISTPRIMLGSPEKYGSLFYFSRDYRFIIKTIHHSKHKFIRKILKDYHEHVCKNPHTLLSCFYGLHRVKLPWGRKIHFVI